MQCLSLSRVLHFANLKIPLTIFLLHSNVLSGKMFKSLDLSLIVEFILMFYKDKPIDWLLDHILWVKVCNPEKDAVSQVLIKRNGLISVFMQKCCLILQLN